jgi:hypothetical protein
LVELTAVASRAVRDGLPAAPPIPIAAAVDRMPRPAARASGGETKAPVVSAEAAAVPASGGSSFPDSTAALAAKMTKELQARAFEDFRAVMDAALDHARDVVDARGAAVASKGDRAAAQYRTVSVELVNAHIETALDCATDLIRATTPARFVEVSSGLVRKQCELALRQASALKSLVQAVAKSDPE